MIHKASARENFYFSHYINLNVSVDLFDAFNVAEIEVVSLFSSIPVEKENYAYADGKWTVKHVLSHLIDTERILSYRALCFSRKETAILAGFDEDNYAKEDKVDHLTIQDLLEEYKAVRKASVFLFKRMNPQNLDFQGNANNALISARELGWTIAGHDLHHCNVIRERYL